MTQNKNEKPDSPYVCVIGGSNIDIVGYPNQKLLPQDSNPGVVKTSLGGVGRNIAENLARLEIETKLISVVGNDIYGKRILEHAKSIGLDMEHTLVADEPSSTFLCVLDETRDMHIGISHMDILERLDIAFVNEHANVVQNASFCVVDTNLPDLLEYLVTSYDVPFVLDTVSVSKAARAKHLLRYFHTIKPNKAEAEILSGIPIHTEADLQKAGEYFIGQGVTECFITMGSDGVYYKTKELEGIITPPKIDMVSASGAGDAFVAGLVYGLQKEISLPERIRFAMGASIMAIRSEDTINPKISPQSIETIVENLDFTDKKF